jgi:hypothetical protein
LEEFSAGWVTRMKNGDGTGACVLTHVEVRQSHFSEFRSRRVKWSIDHIDFLSIPCSS